MVRSTAGVFALPIVLALVLLLSGAPPSEGRRLSSLVEQAAVESEALPLAAQDNTTNATAVNATAPGAPVPNPDAAFPFNEYSNDTDTGFTGNASFTNSSVDAITNLDTVVDAVKNGTNSSTPPPASPGTSLSAGAYLDLVTSAGGPSAGMPTFIDSLLNALSSIFGGFGVLSGT